MDHRFAFVASIALWGTACTGGPITEVTTDIGGDESGTTTTSGSVPPNPTAPNPGTNTGGMTGGDVTGEPPITSGPAETTTVGDTTGDVGGSCCDTHANPGCDEPEVVDCVCAIEASCCAFEWDDLCVELAQGACNLICGEPPPGSTGDEPPGSSSGEPGDACKDPIEIELFPSDATITGSWMVGMSGLGEGEIAIIPNPDMGTDGSVLYEPDIPCDDTWHIWVRGLDFGGADSYYVSLDGNPRPPAVFEANCDDFGDTYVWAELNWRNQGDPACTYVEDPWTAQWDAGIHSIEFSYREINAMGRILLTNGPGFAP